MRQIISNTEKRCKAGLATLFPVRIPGCHSCVLALLMACLCLPAGADTVTLRDGRILVGTVTAADAKSVTIKLKSDVVIKLRLTDLAPAEQYRLKVAHEAPTTAGEHLALGQFCLAHSLVGPARRHFEQAASLDPRHESQVELRLEELDELLAEQIYRRILKLGQAGRYQKALDQIRALTQKFPRTAPAGWSARLADSYRQAAVARDKARRDKTNKTGRSKKDLAREMARERDRQHLRGRTQGYMKEASLRRLEALRSEGEGNENRSLQGFRASSSEYEKALDAVQRYRRLVRDRRHLQQALGWQQEIIHAWALLAISAAHLRARQGNWKDAHRWLGLAIRLEPLNSDARRLHKKVGERRIVKSLQKLTNAKPIIKNR